MVCYFVSSLIFGALFSVLAAFNLLFKTFILAMRRVNVHLGPEPSQLNRTCILLH